MILPASIVMDEAEWLSRRADHVKRLDPVVRAHLQRAANGEKHPVMDFLFTYYPFAPAQLLRWTPGYGVSLAGDIPVDLRALTEAESADTSWRLDIERLPARRRDAVDWLISFLETTAIRPPRYGCSGLHEWAMVYRAPVIRHSQLPLRFSPPEIARIVESQTVCCSHYDAFRFFTSDARPLNRMQPGRDNKIAHDQPGCLHVNMDLYKWSQQFYPWISSDLIADTFELAVEIREVDMRASPYDVSACGLTPIKIETPEGRSEYAAYQKLFAGKAAPLRSRLATAFRQLSTAWRSEISGAAGTAALP